MNDQTSKSAAAIQLGGRAVYLAGPDVFHPEIARIRREKKALCEAGGFRPLDPCDNDNFSSSEAIYLANLTMVDRADLVVANLTPFRGVEPDSGTVFEVARAIALGKPVFGYMASLTVQMNRVEAFYGPIVYDDRLNPDRCQWPCSRDRDGYAVEDFGLPLNLMVFHGLVSLSMSFEEALKQAISHQKLAATGHRAR